MEFKEKSQVFQKSFDIFKQRMDNYRNSKILIMLSGGVDSILLSNFLLLIKNEYNLKLISFHLNHMYRGKDADRDADFVRRYSEENGIKAYIEKENIEEISKKIRKVLNFVLGK